MKRQPRILPPETYKRLRRLQRGIPHQDRVSQGLPFITAETKDRVSESFGLGEYSKPILLWNSPVSFGFRYPHQILSDVSVSELKVWDEYCPGMVDQLSQWVGKHFSRSLQELESATVGGTIVFAAYRQQLGFEAMQRYANVDLGLMLKVYEKYNILPDDTIFSRAKSKLAIPTHQVNLREIVESVVNISPSEHSVNVSSAVTYRVMETFW